MSDQPTPPPWRREYAKLSYLEKVLWYHYFDDGDPRVHEQAWDELIELLTRLAALERVAKAAEKCTGKGFSDYAECEKLLAAIDAAKETTC